MPYDFKDCETGEVVQLDLTFIQLMDMDVERKIKHKGRWYQRYIEPTERVTVSSVGNLAYNTPLESRSAGVHSTQAAEFNEAARAAGITGVEYSPKTGNPKFSCRSARRKELARRGLRDQDGGYGDG